MHFIPRVAVLLCYGWLSKWRQWHFPFKDTPFCFQLTGYTNYLFISRKRCVIQLKGRAQGVSRGSVDWHADRICAWRPLPDLIITWGKWARILRLTSSQITTSPHVKGPHGRDSEVTQAARRPPSWHSPPLTVPWKHLGASREMLPSGPHARRADFTGLGCSQGFMVFKITPQLRSNVQTGFQTTAVSSYQDCLNHKILFPLRVFFLFLFFLMKEKKKIS